MLNQSVLLLNKPEEQKYIASLTAEGQEEEVLGIIIADKPGEYRLSVTSDHYSGDSYGRVIIRGIVSNGAKVIVNGLVKIRPNAQEVDDFLEIRLLVLDEKSSAIAEPELEIEANSVKASHAATIGQIDKEQIFYLQSRGVSRLSAEQIIIRGFLNQVIEKIEDNKLKDKLTKMLE